jgi:hypothetical protein
MSDEEIESILKDLEHGVLCLHSTDFGIRDYLWHDPIKAKAAELIRSLMKQVSDLNKRIERLEDDCG